MLRRFTVGVSAGQGLRFTQTPMLPAGGNRCLLSARAQEAVLRSLVKGRA
ncbi:hypothetical protein [Actinokineospora sp. NPDC004072]